MKLLRFIGFLVTTLLSQNICSNPYWDSNQAPTEKLFTTVNPIKLNPKSFKVVTNQVAIDVLRIQVDWNEIDESYRLSHFVIEPSGTKALLAKSKHKPKWGSYLGVLKEKNSGTSLYYDSIGTGKEYRKLARAINLRFPVPTQNMIFELYAENPQSGVMEVVLTEEIDPSSLQKAEPFTPKVVVKELAVAEQGPVIRVNIYAEGYLATDEQQFWQHAKNTVEALYNQHFPGVEYMSFYGVFSPSAVKLGAPKDLGLPVPVYNTFLGLYYPYWDNFGRWYHIVYPTQENKFRKALASAPYDYPIVLVNDNGYWGVGNYMSHTAIPAANGSYFTYLLVHEFGHFFGLNEEYEGGGRTELEFAEDIEEPWSQNMTFLLHPTYDGLKWKEFANPQVRLPTPDSDWRTYPPVYGAYQGGYGSSSSSRSVNHKPGLSCVMDRYQKFCDVCKQGILDVIHHSQG